MYLMPQPSPLGDCGWPDQCSALTEEPQCLTRGPSETTQSQLGVKSLGLPDKRGRRARFNGPPRSALPATRNRAALASAKVETFGLWRRCSGGPSQAALVAQDRIGSIASVERCSLVGGLHSPPL